MKDKINFTISERNLFLRIIDVLIVNVAIITSTTFFEFEYFRLLDTNIVTWLFTLSFYIAFFGQILEMYDLKVSRSRLMIFKSVAITSLLTTSFYIFTPLIAPVLPSNRLQILFLFATIFVPLLVWRFLYILLIFSPKYFKYVLLIGNEKKLSDVVKLINHKASGNYIVGYLSDKKIESFKELSFFNHEKQSVQDLIQNNQVSEIIVAKSKFSRSENIYKQLIHLFENGVPITSAEKFVESITGMVPELKVGESFYDYLNISKSHQSNLYHVLIRLIDVIVALIGVLFLTFLLPLILLGNLFANRGPLFYHQTRVGEKGETFEILKLRSMVTNAEKDGAVWAQKNDTRITLFGKILRKSRLDEIPQFINILKGDMSLIGPRPERPEFVRDLEKKIPFYAIRHVVKPGLTGWAQVKHPYANTLDDSRLKVRYDLFYIKERSLLLDFKIVIKTITTVLFFRGN